MKIAIVTTFIFLVLVTFCFIFSHSNYQEPYQEPSKSVTKVNYEEAARCVDHVFGPLPEFCKTREMERCVYLGDC